MGKIPEHRELLNKISLEQGLIYSLEYLNSYGLFEALKSWVDAPGKDLRASELMFLRFEDIVDLDGQFAVFSRLFGHCGMPLAENEIKIVLDKYCFDRMKKKKNKKGLSPYRKEIPGDWKNYFDETLRSQFAKMSNNLITRLGYHGE